MTFQTMTRRTLLGLSGFAAGCLLASTALAEAGTAQPAPATPPGARTARAAPATEAAASRKSSPYSSSAKLTPKAEAFYSAAWGLDKLRVSSTSSGNLIRFSYRVSDPNRAQVLSDKKLTPYLLGQKSRALLQVPVMDKVGQLRQATALQAGQEYWMVFSNKGNLIKPGDRVDVIIGSFHANGLVVERS
jgi:hypothetical protein